MTQKIYTLTISYDESDIGDQIITGDGNPENKTNTERDLERFINYLKEIEVKPEPNGFGAKVDSIVAQ